MSIPDWCFRKMYERLENGTQCTIQISGVPTVHTIKEIFRVAKEDFPTIQPDNIEISIVKPPDKEQCTNGTFLTTLPIPITYSSIHYFSFLDQTNRLSPT